jgi:ABC-type Mn2+/Zn2+ transport system ATPase subunit
MSAATVRLDRFRILAYRSCKDTSFALSSGATALIGRNGAGKTNVMHGILLLALSTARRGRISDADVSFARQGAVEAEFLVGKKRVLLRASIVYRPSKQTGDEVGLLKEQWNFRDIDGKSIWLSSDELGLIISSENRFSFQMRPDFYPSPTLRQSIHKLAAIPRSQLRKRIPSEKVRRAYERIQLFRARLSYYSASQFTNPGLCPTSFDLDEDGDLEYSSAALRRSPHTRFIFDLYRLSKDNKDSYKTFLSLVDGQGLSLVNKIKWREVKFSSPAYEVRAGGSVVTKRETRTMIIPTVHIGTSQLSFSQLSEGSLRTLAMLFYVVTDKSELLLLEEPEVCVHHGLLRSVLEVIKEYGRTKQIIISTHSEAVVDSLEPEQVLIVEKTSKRGTVVMPISQSLSQSDYRALKGYLSTSGNLGEYWRHRGFDK